MKTIKVKPWAPEQGDHVVINRADFNPSVHELVDGEVLEVGGAGERVPTMAELVAARDALMRREQELDEQALAMAEQKRAQDAEATRLQEWANANAAEAQRLAEEAARLAALADVNNMTNDQLKAALDAKGVKYPANANKADLQALLAQ
jgi:hypothetical protein